MNYNFGQKVEFLLQERGRTKKSLYDHLKMTANGLDAMIKNNTMTAMRLVEIADYFGIPVAYFYGESNALPEAGQQKGDDYLRQHIANLEGSFSRLSEQLATKDQQISNLHEMLKTVLGKFERVINGPIFALLGEFDQNNARYTHTTLKGAVDAMLTTN